MRALLLTLLMTVPGAPAWPAPLPKPEPPEPRLELRLQTTTPKLKRGQDVRCEVTILNRGKHEVLLVQPGDGSDCGWRTPIIEWVVNGKVDGARQGSVEEKTKVRTDRASPPAPKPLRPACLEEGAGRVARCGNINALKADEVFVLKPGEQVRLNAWACPSGLQTGSGTFKLAVRYFHIPDLKWRGLPLGQHDPMAMERIRKSAAVTLESNVVEIEVSQ
jgi:hypothetical protein